MSPRQRGEGCCRQGSVRVGEKMIVNVGENKKQLEVVELVCI